MEIKRKIRQAKNSGIAKGVLIGTLAMLALWGAYELLKTKSELSDLKFQNELKKISE